MVKKLSIGLVSTIWLVGFVYLALLSNWFRYGFSLEAMFVAIPLLLGALISSVFALLAYRSNSLRQVVMGIIAAGMTGLFVVAVQLHAFGKMPSLYIADFEKSPTGRVVTRQGAFDYWIELKNPFAISHSEYIVIRRDAKERRFKVPIFSEKAVGGYVSAGSVADWGQLETTADPDVYILKIGPHFPSSGNSFRINVHTGLVEIAPAKHSLTK
jgi:hypothetical protein